MVKAFEYVDEMGSAPGFSLSNSVIVEAIVGSTSQGTNLESSSDTDLRGIAIPPPGIVLGLDTWGTTSLKIGETDTSSGQDVEYHSLAKFIGLALKGNPTVLELLWLEDRFYTYRTPTFDTLRALRDLFSFKEAKHAFKGFAVKQIERMVEGHKGNAVNPDKIDRIDQFGYDTKMAAHSVRILREGTEFMATGVLNVFRHEDAIQLKDIKTGLWSLEGIRELIKIESDKLEEAYTNSKLPDYPDRVIASNILKDLTLKFWDSHNLLR